jgi:4,5-dihydroxyphthalate decarboxylase
MQRSFLECAFAPGPLTTPLLAGEIGFERFQAKFLDLPLRAIFDRAFDEAPFDLCELSFGRYVQAVGANAPLAYAGLPAFTHRRFRHDVLHIRDDGSVTAPPTLAGRRIGVPSWAQTALVTCRGRLLDEHGIPAAGMRWVLGGVNAPAALPMPRLHRADIEIAAVADRSLADLLASGEIDAVMALEAPSPPSGSRVRFRPLVSDPKAAADDAYRRFGTVPIMHLVAIRKDRLAADPALCADVLASFEQARALSARKGNAEAETSPIGVEANGTAIGQALRWALDQGLLARPLAIDSLFP